ncbi:MAG: hypothetical protein GY927_19365 [bacterium]|nr:hypothetical protein [bacterium]
MTSKTGSGVTWEEAEIDLAAWQGLRSLRFATVPSAGFEVELVATLARAANGISAGDVQITTPDGQLNGFDVQFIADEIRILFPTRGARGTHSVILNSGGVDPLHPFFSEASFDFFIDCPAGDCRVGPVMDTTAGLAEPAIDLTAKDFTGFMRVGSDWALATDANWSDLSTASAERMLVELLAHHADMLSLHQDRVVQEAFIDTARERLAVKRHGSLLGVEIAQGGSANTVVAIDVGAAGYLPVQCPIVRLEEGGEQTIGFETTDAVFLDPDWNAGLEDIADAGLLRVAAWPGASDAITASGATRMLLLGWDLQLSPGQRIGLIQGSQSHVATLISVNEYEAPGWTDDPVNVSTTVLRRVTEVVWDQPTLTDFSPWVDPAELPFLITANLVDAVHGTRKRASNSPGTGDVPLSGGRRDCVFAEESSGTGPLIRALRTPEENILHDAKSDRPQLSINIDGQPWSWETHLWGSAGFDQHFTTEREEDSSVWCLFGDSERGAAVQAANGPALPDSATTKIEVEYLVGDPATGNVSPFALNGVGTHPFDITVNNAISDLAIRAVVNVTAGVGGERPVSLDAARLAIPESITHPPLERAVTLQDYAAAALTVAGVSQAAAKLIGGLFNTIGILVAPEDTDELSEELAVEVYRVIDQLRMAGREHIVQAPDYVPLDIALLVCPTAEAGVAETRQAVRDALSAKPENTDGFFHRSNLDFGSDIMLSDVLAAVQRQPAISAVKALQFRPLRDSNGLATRQAIELGPTEVAQFSADEAKPEKGRLTIRIQGIDPSIPPGAFSVASPPAELSGGIV